MGNLVSTELTEVSGVVASRAHPGILWVHNDSGDSPRVFAIDESGALKATIRLKGATSLDYEDIALGPCDEGTCIFIADIGDNLGARDFCTLYRFAEPTDIVDAEIEVTPTRFTYPDGPHNAETLLVHPATGLVYVVTKEENAASSVFQIPTGDVVVANELGSVTPPEGSSLFTGGDIDPTGAMVVLRTYDHVFAYPIPASNRVEDALASTPCTVPAPPEVQGEAVGFSGKDFWTISEGKGATVYRTKCSWTP